MIKLLPAELPPAALCAGKAVLYALRLGEDVWYIGRQKRWLNDTSIYIYIMYIYLYCLSYLGITVKHLY